MNHETKQVFIGLGSNLGDRSANLRAALDRMGRWPRICILRVTDFLETPPWGVTDQPPFLNAVVLLETDIPPLELLDLLKSAEAELGRCPGEKRWGPRVIDLDILLYGDLVVEHPRLTIPHAELLNRDFVVTQLLELDPDIIFPGRGVPLRDLL